MYKHFLEYKTVCKFFLPSFSLACILECVAAGVLSATKRFLQDEKE